MKQIKFLSTQIKYDEQPLLQFRGPEKIWKRR